MQIKVSSPGEGLLLILAIHQAMLSEVAKLMELPLRSFWINVSLTQNTRLMSGRLGQMMCLRVGDMLVHLRFGLEGSHNQQHIRKLMKILMLKSLPNQRTL